MTTKKLTTPKSDPVLAILGSEPLMVDPSYAEVLRSSAIQVSSFLTSPQANMASTDFWTVEGGREHPYRPYNVESGVLRLEVHGMLLHNFPYKFFSIATGYEYLTEAIRRGLADESVKSIALEINSGGGMVSGAFDLADFIYESRKEKPIHALVNEAAYSAAYAIASSAETITMPRTGGVGSIGVVTMHADVSDALQKDGIKITFIHAGKFKVEGNAYEALGETARDRIQERINGMYDLFVATVARNRGIEESDVRATEALTYSAKSALSNKLADRIGTLAAGFSELASKNNNPNGVITMTKTTEIDQDAALKAAADQGFAEGVVAGSTDERARISAILTAPEAEGRESTARTLALTTNMGAEEAIAVMATLPTAAVNDKVDPFAAAMDKAKHPEIGADNGAGEGEQASRASQIIAAHKAATGAK